MAEIESGKESNASRASEIDATLRAHALRLWETEAILEKLEQTSEVVRARALVDELHTFWAKSVQELGLKLPTPRSGDVIPNTGGGGK
jgi:hypothetical protein